MPNPVKKFEGFMASLPKRIFETTGFHLHSLLRVLGVLFIAAIGVGGILLFTGAEQDGRTSEPDFAPKQLTSKEKLRAVSSLPAGFSKGRPVVKVGILNSRIKDCEELASSEDEYADQAREQLLFLYGTRCRLEETEGLDAEKTYRKLAQLRQAALAAGNKKRVATADLLRAIAATNRLKRRTEPSDFRFASDAVVGLDSKDLLNFGEARKLYHDVVDLHFKSSKQDNTGVVLSLIADKLIGSPESKVAELGWDLKDYPRYFRFYEAINDLPYSSSESKAEFYDDLFAEIEKAPPQSPNTYRVFVELIDRLIVKSELQSVSLLAERLFEAAAILDPKVKFQIDESIESVKMRIASLGKR